MPTRWLALVGVSLMVLLLGSLALAMWGHQGAKSDLAVEAEEVYEPSSARHRVQAKSNPVSDEVRAAQDCVKVEACARIMLDAVWPWRSDVVRAAAASLEQYAARPAGNIKKARVLNQQALQYLYRGEETRAVELLERALKAHPADADVMSNLGWALVRVGRLAEAESVLLGALEIAPQRSAIWIRLAVTLNERDQAEDARKALLLAYAFSTQKDNLIEYFMGRAQSTEFNAHTRGMFARTLEELSTRQQEFDRFLGES